MKCKDNNKLLLESTKAFSSTPTTRTALTRTVIPVRRVIAEGRPGVIEEGPGGTEGGPGET